MSVPRAMACLVASVVTLVATAGSRASDPESGRGAASPAPVHERAAHVLDRIGFGGDEWSRARIRELGVRGYIEEQLRPESIADEAAQAALATLPSLELDFLELREAYSGEDGKPAPGKAVAELRRAKSIRAIASRRQLQEVLVDFWFNHFNIFAKTKRRSYDTIPYERDAIRPYVLGRFHSMLAHVARSPAMLDYLDNRRNRAGAINENYGRELLELHTLGVRGGYTEEDVVDVARCFTGWAEDYDAPDGFRFRERFHDQGAKRILGLEIPEHQGYRDGLIVLDYLAHHPTTARHLVSKLVTRFVAEEDPPAGLIDAATVTFLATGGDLREVMRTILLSDAFLEADAIRGSKVKRPFVFMASLARTLGTDPLAMRPGRVDRVLSSLGERPYACSPPTGYPDSSEHWLAPGAVVMRFNETDVASRGGGGYAKGRALPKEARAEAVIEGLVRRHFLAGVSDSTRSGALAVFESVRGRPTRRAAAALSFLFSSPEFLTH